jgi:hypothetical protein
MANSQLFRVNIVSLRRCCQAAKAKKSKQIQLNGRQALDETGVGIGAGKVTSEVLLNGKLIVPSLRRPG